MAIETTAEMRMSLLFGEKLDATIDPGYSGEPQSKVENATGGRRWTWAATGASGSISKGYKRIRSGLAASATDSYDLLAAGSLTTPQGETIDADEIKGLIIKCTSGECKFVATSSNGLDCFSAADEGLQLKAAAGLRAAQLDFGPDGMDVTTNSKFAVIETSTSTTADYELELIISE